MNTPTMYLGWRKTPEVALKERRKAGTRELLRSGRRQEDLRKTVDQLKEAVKREKNPQEKRYLCEALVRATSELNEEMTAAVRIQQNMSAMDRDRRMVQRVDDVQARAAALTSLSRRVSPASISRTHETMLTAQSSLEVVSELMDDIDRPSSEKQQSMDDEVNAMLERLDSEDALDIATSMPSAPVFPATPLGDAPSPHPTVQDDLQARLDKLLSIRPGE